MSTETKKVDVLYMIRKFERTYMVAGLNDEASDMAIIHTTVSELIESLNAVLPYVVSDMLEHCNGNKCRESWCIGCSGEEYATDSVAKANAATTKAYALLARVGGVP
ncbi:hypothetical protein [Dyella jiangningensis]|jgi:hypothetical protein